MASKRGNFEDLNLTSDEVQRLSKALKDEEFRKLLVEYAEEISDPENRKRYEEEIAILEGERGMDVKFVHPQPGYVMKTVVDGKLKAFINICKNEHIGKPSSHRKTGHDGRSGMQWSIPHSFSPVRDETDKAGNKCKVYDVIFHPDTYRMAESNARFKKMLHDTALDGIEKQFGVQLDKTNLKFPKMKFKGTATATVIRTRQDAPEQTTEKVDPKDDVLSRLPYPYDNLTSEEKAQQVAQKNKEKKESKEHKKKLIEEINGEQKENKSPNEKYTTPEYTIVHRSHLDLQEYRDAPDARTSTRPNQLVISIELPLLKSAASANLDIFEKRLLLQSETPAAYKLDIDLPYVVDENLGKAKFDKSKKKLVITLPVVPQEDLPKTDMNGTEKEAESELVQSDCLTRDALVQELESACREDEMPDEAEQLSDSAVPEETKKAPLVSYCYPNDIRTHQDLESLTLVIPVANIIADSIKLTFAEDERVADLTFTNMGSGCFPVHYRVQVEAPEAAGFVEEGSYFSPSSENLVICVMKNNMSKRAWEMCKAGMTKETMEDIILLTEETLKAEIDDLENARVVENTEIQGNMELKVTEMNEDKLEVLLENVAPKGLITRSDRRTCSESEIEVIHNKEVPKLHGILKQRSRTLSESSDDALSSSYSRQTSLQSGYNGASESTIEESEENEDEGFRKKSVSFSDHIDSTLYKTNASVASLKNTLKNRRKKARKREAKKEHKRSHRRRCNSGSSEISSSEEQVSNTDDAQDEDEDSPSAKALPKPQTSSPKPGKEVAAPDAGLDDVEVEQKVTKDKVKEITASLEQENDDGTDEDDIEDEVNLNHSPDALQREKKGTEGQIVESVQRKGMVNGLKDEKKAEEEDDGSKPETMLSWSEGNETGSVPKETTQPSLGLSNSLMFELDD